MVHAPAMMRTHPHAVDKQELIQCIETCFDCAQACLTCADACLGELSVAQLTRCIRLNMDCAAICQATGSVLSRQTDTEWRLVKPLLGACIEASRICAEECERHAEHMEHCRICAEACRECQQACDKLLTMI